MKTVALSLLAILVVASTYLTVSYRSEMKAARERIAGRATVVPSPFGEIEYSIVGSSGPDVLVVHGAGGGFDQGELIVHVVLNDEVRAVVPSRFGYLGSSAPAGATYDEQAHAYAWLLDHLGLDRVAVVGLSSGGPSALLFAALHPERVSSLTLLSAGVTRVAAEDQAQADWKGRMLVRLYRSDFGYWMVTKLFRTRVMSLMGAGDEVIPTLSDEQRAWVGRTIDYMNPASPRYPGVVLDNTSALPGPRIAGIRAPTLVVHAEDDTLQLFDNALFAAATIPGARLLRFPRGGHFVMIIEQATVGEAVRNHILDHAM